jgi:general secretion pathway protein D
MNRARFARWLLVMWTLTGCASAGAPAVTPGDTARTRVEVTTEAQPVPSAPAGPTGPASGAPAGTLSVGPAQPAEPSPVPPPALTAPPPPAPVPPPPIVAQAPVRPPAPAAASARRQIVFNFDNAEVELVIQAAAEIVGFNYVLAPGVRGRTVTVKTIGQISADEVFAVLLSILDVNGLAAVRSGNLYRIIPREGAPQTSIKTVVGREVDPAQPADEIITQVVPLAFIGAADAVTLLRPLVPQAGALGAHPESNFLIITDTVANIRRLLDIVRVVDAEGADSELRIIPLMHADAQELAQLLTELFARGRLGTGPSGVGAGVPPPVPPPPPSPAPGAPPVAPRPPLGGAAAPQGSESPLIVPERRSNSLVVHARKRDVETIRRLVEKLDVDIYGGRRVFIYFVENTKAKDLATTLDAIYGSDRGPSITGVQPPVRTPSISSSPYGVPTTTTPVAPLAPIGPLAPPVSSLPAPGLGARPPGSFPGLAVGEGGAPAAEVRIIADEVTNAIIVPTYPRLWKEIEETIKKLDKMPRQVLIEVLAAEVTLTDDTKLGLEWAIRTGRFDLSSSPSGVLPGRPERSLIPFGGPVPLGFNFFTFAADKFLAALNALASENKVNVLSNPSIMTAENKKAVINVSTSVPIVTSQQVPVATGGITGNAITQTVEYKDAGIILAVTPRIGEQGTVALDVKQEVNEVGANEPPPINSPRFTKREAETSVVLLNNQTLVLGGLIQNRRTLIRTGVPFLNRIPVLGYLFGAVEHRIEKTELLLLITPRTVGTVIDAARITDEMRRITPEIEQSIRRAPRPPVPESSIPAAPRAKRVRSVSGRVVVERGSAERVPAYGYLRVSVEGARFESPIGRDGEFYFENLPAGRHPAVIEDRDGRCAFSLDAPVVGPPSVDLGTLRCAAAPAR